MVTMEVAGRVVVAAVPVEHQGRMVQEDKMHLQSLSSWNLLQTDSWLTTEKIPTLRILPSEPRVETVEMEEQEEREEMATAVTRVVMPQGTAQGQMEDGEVMEEMEVMVVMGLMEGMEVTFQFQCIPRTSISL